MMDSKEYHENEIKALNERISELEQLNNKNENQENIRNYRTRTPNKNYKPILSNKDTSIDFEKLISASHRNPNNYIEKQKLIQKSTNKININKKYDALNNSYKINNKKINSVKYKKSSKNLYSNEHDIYKNKNNFIKKSKSLIDASFDKSHKNIYLHSRSPMTDRFLNSIQ